MHATLTLLSRLSHIVRLMLAFLFIALLTTVDDLSADEAAEPQSPANPAVGIRVPDGFEVTLFADDKLAHDIFSMTIDSKGRVVVAGANFVKILEDTDNDGVADSSKLFADAPKTGSQGMYFHGSDLICTGDAGLLRFKDRDQDDKADGPPDVFLRIKCGGEHDAHSVQRGPDGWWYVLAGNNAGVDKKYVTLPNSPVQNPEHGTLMRLKPDLSGGEVVAHGYRNPYDFAFNQLGDIFVYDSDGERDASLPWWRPTRVFQALPTSHAGWHSRSWKRPDDFIDMPPVIDSFGRGCPTGVVCYRHRQFPPKFQNALFVLDWTFGRVHAIGMQRGDNGWQADSSLFMEGKGTFGFAPTDAAIGPDGSLFVCVGGRGTRGGVYRVRFVGDQQPAILATDQLQTVLDAPQPLSSWSREKWVPQARELGADAFKTAAADETVSAAERVRAIEILTELFGGVDEELADKLADSESAPVRARAIWSVGRSTDAKLSPNVFAKFLGDEDQFVVRSTLEALSASAFDWDANATAALLKACDSKHRFVRQLAGRIATRVPSEVYVDLVKQASKKSAQAVITLAFSYAQRSQKVNLNILDTALQVVEGKYPDALKLEAVRVMQLALSDVGPVPGRVAAFDSYAPTKSLEKLERELDPIRIRLGKIFPTGHDAIDRELSRVIAMVSPLNPKLLESVVAKITDTSHPTNDLHFLLVASRFEFERGFSVTEATAKALVGIDVKVKRLELKQDTNWDDRIQELYTALAKYDPALAITAVRQPGFGNPGHVFLLQQLQPQFLEEAVTKFAEKLESSDEIVWNTDIIFVLGESKKPEHRELIREQFSNFAVRDAVLMTLAERPEPADAPLLIEGLGSSSVKTVGACVDGLAKLQLDRSPEHIAALVKVLRRLGRERSEVPVRDRAVAQLQKLAKRRLGYQTGTTDSQSDVIAKWSTWFRGEFPANENLLGVQVAGVDAIREQLAQTDWSLGDASKGRVIYEQRRCAQCHNGSRALGPDLSGVARRFSREDLFTAILEPDRDVSPRYQTTIVETKAGKVERGMIVYQSVDGLTIRNAELQTIRLEANEIEERRQINTSLMPTGLLKDLKSSELADLYAYLRQLGGGVAKRDR